MISFPNAKINLGLNITQKRGDGFHEIETVFLPITLTDVLETLPLRNKINSTNISFSSTGLGIEGNESNNLCVKGYHLLKNDFPELQSVQMHLHKTIPMGAGLGGGSADAAFVLQQLNTQFNLKITQEKLLNYALQLGSDCPFFIINKPCYATSRGENLSIITIDFSPYSIVVINPQIHINTGWAFNNITPQKSNKNIVDIISQPILTWGETLINDFESPIFDAYSDIASIKKTLLNIGAVYASLSGTGSTVYGIFYKNEIPKDIKNYFPSNYFLKIVTVLS